MKTKRAGFHEVPLARGAARRAGGHTLPPAVALLGAPPGALETLRGRSIAVAACGSVGGRIALLLARMGIGTLYLIDPKNIKVESLATHEICPTDVGQPKALVLARRCKAINPAARVLAFVGPMEALDWTGFAGVDLVAMAPDLLTAEVAIGQRCLWLGKPLVQAAVHGPTLTAQVRFFLNAKAAGGCPACSYGQVEWDLMTRQVQFSCDGAANASPLSPADAPRTNSLGALCSLGADLAVIQILKFFLKIGQPVADTMLEYNGFTHQTVVSPLGRHPRCKLEHMTYTPAVLDGPLPSLTLAQIAQRATGNPISPDAQFEIPGLAWVEFAACGCAEPVPVRQFVPPAGTQLATCQKCSRPMTPLSFYTHRAASVAVLGSALDQPLRKLGARRVASVLLRTGEAGLLVCAPPSTSARP